ncbi:MAG: methyl-accepting chemotaxis protein [SAR324 cluster bacterium]|nr:methyl-accepting chemotaxis protein [SAR324 cluster bacterium]
MKIRIMLGVALLIQTLILCFSFILWENIQPVDDGFVLTLSMLIFLMGILMTLILLVLFLLFVGTFIPLMRSLQSAANFDFSIPVPGESQHELGLIGKELNQLISGSSRLQTHLKDHHTMLKTNNVSLSNLIQRLQDIAGKTLKDLKSFEHHAKLTIHEIQHRTQKNQDFDNLLEDLGEKMCNIQEEIQSGLKSNQEDIKNLNVVSGQSDSIERSTKQIMELVNQTATLALNAAIEASKAGEHGKGFAVVAEEMRNIANKIKNFAHDIKTQSNQINDSVVVAEETLKKTRTILVHIDTISKTGKETVEHLQAMIDKMEHQVSDIERQMGSFSERSHDRVQSFKELDEIAYEQMRIFKKLEEITLQFAKLNISGITHS